MAGMILFAALSLISSLAAIIFSTLSKRFRLSPHEKEAVIFSILTAPFFAAAIYFPLRPILPGRTVEPVKSSQAIYYYSEEYARTALEYTEEENAQSDEYLISEERESASEYFAKIFSALSRLAPIVWITVSAALIIKLFWGYLKAAAGLRRRRKYLFDVGRIHVYLTDGISSPMAAGIFHPAIYTRSKDISAPALRHELAHIKRLDILKRLVLEIISRLCWFDPFYRICKEYCIGLSEICCDMTALEGEEYEARKEYARAILSLSSKSSGALEANLSRSGERLRDRIKNIMESDGKSPKKRYICAAASAALVIISFGAYIISAPPEERIATKNRAGLEYFERYSLVTDDSALRYGASLVFTGKDSCEISALANGESPEFSYSVRGKSLKLENPDKTYNFEITETGLKFISDGSDGLIFETGGKTVSAKSGDEFSDRAAKETAKYFDDVEEYDLCFDPNIYDEAVTYDGKKLRGREYRYTVREDEAAGDREKEIRAKLDEVISPHADLYRGASREDWQDVSLLRGRTDRSGVIKTKLKNRFGEFLFERVTETDFVISDYRGALYIIKIIPYTESFGNTEYETVVVSGDEATGDASEEIRNALSRLFDGKSFIRPDGGEVSLKYHEMEYGETLNESGSRFSKLTRIDGSDFRYETEDETVCYYIYAASERSGSDRPKGELFAESIKLTEESYRLRSEANRQSLISDWIASPDGPTYSERLPDWYGGAYYNSGILDPYLYVNLKYESEEILEYIYSRVPYPDYVKTVECSASLKDLMALCDEIKAYAKKKTEEDPDGVFKYLSDIFYSEENTYITMEFDKDTSVPAEERKRNWDKIGEEIEGIKSKYCSEGSYIPVVGFWTSYASSNA